MNGALARRAVLVTRPAGLSDRLVALLRAAGGEAVLLPAIEILDADDGAALGAAIDQLEEYDFAIFVSPTAAAMANAAVRARRDWPAGLKRIAVGRGTASALRGVGMTDVSAPEGRGDSDAVAALPELAEVAGRRIVIFRGQGGREVLREALEARGAKVDYAECYRRALPRVDIGPLAERWRRGGIDAVSITSAEGLRNLFQLIGADGQGGALLRATPVFVPHPRVGEAARSLGIERVIVTGAGDDALIEALDAFFAKV